jgi:23S rRNA (guanosine2251-2'-O)-methyltransferase
MRRLRPEELARPDPAALAALPRRPLAVVVADVRSAHNVGSVFRTADAFRLAEVVLTGYTPDPTHQAVQKTALGAEGTVPWRRFADAEAALAALSAEGYTAVALEQTDRSHPLDALPPLPAPLALVLGSEVEGVPQAVLDRCALAVEIPQEGAKHSLNVSVAFGVAAWALTRALGA